MNNKWLEWATKLQSIAQAGLTFGENQYVLVRYQQIRDLSVEILPELSVERNTLKQINMCFEAKKCKLFETIFD